MKNGGGSKADEAMQGGEIKKSHLMIMIMMRAMKQLMRLVKKMMSLMRKMIWEE